jgi:hypothetical protein
MSYTPIALSAEGTAQCALCHHPIHAVKYVGWVDSLPAVKGGTYDMCERGDPLSGSLHSLTARSPALLYAGGAFPNHTAGPLAQVG